MPVAPSSSDSPKRVLVTGAAGWIGSEFARATASRYRLRLLTLPNDAKARDISGLGEVLSLDIGDLEALRGAMKDIDVVLHLAGDPSPSATWGHLLETNVVGTYNVCVAALAAGVKRVIYASSIHAVSGYPADVQVKPNEPVNPGDLYGVSKCFGESLGRYMAEQEGLSFVAIRIGAYQPDEKIVREGGVRLMDSWVSPRDLQQLFCKCIDADDLKFAIFHGVSDNRFKRLDISNARELVGYAPQDDSARTNQQLKPLDLPAKAMTHSLSDSDNPRAASGLREEL